MSEILFATGSADKLAEVQAILSMDVEQFAVDLEEIQGTPEEVIKAKLESAYKLCAKPVVVDDVSAEAVALGGFPGPYIKWAEQAMGDSALYKMLLGHEDKRVLVQSIVGYHDGQQMHFFKGSYTGIVVEPRGTRGWGFDKVVIPDGYDQTVAEMPTELKNSISHRYLAFSALAEHLRS